MNQATTYPRDHDGPDHQVPSLDFSPWVARVIRALDIYGIGRHAQHVYGRARDAQLNCSDSLEVDRYSPGSPGE